MQQYSANWQGMLQALIELFELPVDESNIEGDNFIEIEDTAGYQVAYSQLNFATGKRDDPVSEIPDGKRYLIENLSRMNQPEVRNFMRQMPTHHQAALQKYGAQFGVSLI